MKIQYASDLHLEFESNKAFLKRNPIKPLGDILVLAGDILPFVALDKHNDFFTYLSNNFTATYWLPGNHEYYYSDIAMKPFSYIEKIKKNVFLVNNISIDHDGIRLVFTTLWSNIRPENEWHIEHNVSDFRVIKEGKYRLSVRTFNQLHQMSLTFLKDELKNIKAHAAVVVTHHVPTLLNYPEKYKNSLINNAFAVELFSLIEKHKPGLWIYGHSHCNTREFAATTTKMLTNQLGYVDLGEHYEFNLGACFEV